MFRGESQHQHQAGDSDQMFHHRALQRHDRGHRAARTCRAGRPGTVASVDSQAAAAPSQRGPNNENYDPPIYTPTARPCTTARPATRSSASWGVYQGLAEMPGSRTSRRRRSSRRSSTRSSSARRRPGSATGSPTARSPSASEKYIELTTGGDPDVLVQIAVFRMEPWELEACTRLPTPAEQASYKTLDRRLRRRCGRRPHGDHHAAGRPVRAVRPRRLEGAVRS